MFLRNMLGVYIPLFVQHHTQKALDLHHLQTVPVPYHINQELIEDQSKGNHEMDQSHTNCNLNMTFWQCHIQPTYH